MQNLENLILELNKKILKLENENNFLKTKLEETNDMLSTCKEYIQELTLILIEQKEREKEIIKVEEGYYDYEEV